MGEVTRRQRPGPPAGPAGRHPRRPVLQNFVAGCGGVAARRSIASRQVMKLTAARITSAADDDPDVDRLAEGHRAQRVAQTSCRKVTGCVTVTGARRRPASSCSAPRSRRRRRAKSQATSARRGRHPDRTRRSGSSASDTTRLQHADDDRGRHLAGQLLGHEVAAGESAPPRPASRYARGRAPARPAAGRSVPPAAPPPQRSAAAQPAVSPKNSAAPIVTQIGLR